MVKDDEQGYGEEVWKHMLNIFEYVEKTGRTESSNRSHCKTLFVLNIDRARAQSAKQRHIYVELYNNQIMQLSKCTYIASL